MALSHLSAAGITDVGAKRKNNEDSIVLLPDYGIYCVADGMGGAQGGEVASAEVVSQLESSFSSLPSPTAISSISGRGKIVVRALNRASRVVKKYSEERGISGTGSTAVVLAFDEKDPTRAMILHAGDSRAYRLRDRTLVQMSADHTVAAAAGIADDNDLPPMFRGVVTRAVGVKAKVEVERTPVDVRPGDLFLLASDGLDKMVSDARITEIMLAHPVDQIQNMAKALVDEANKCGGVDNVSVVIVHAGLNAPVEAYRYTKADEDTEAALIGEDAEAAIEAPESESTETGAGRHAGEAGAEEELTPSRTGAVKAARKAAAKARPAKRPWWSRLLDLPTYLQIGLPLGIAAIVIAAMLMGRKKPEEPSAWAQYDEVAPPLAKGADAETPKTEPAESEEDVAARILSRLEEEEAAPDTSKDAPQPEAQDAARVEAERKTQEEAAQLKAQQEKERLEAERKAAEEKARIESERKAQEETAQLKAQQEKTRLEAAGKAAEEKARVEAERKAQEEAAQLKAQQEKTRLEAERKAAEEKTRVEAERKAQEEAAQLKAQQEKTRLEAAGKAAEEKARVEAERKAQEEAAQLKAQQEKTRLEAERKAAEEKTRVEAERRAQEEAAQLKAQQEKTRLEAERKAAEDKARIESERKAQEEAAQLKAQQEKERLEAERKAADEKARVEAERKAQEEAAQLKAQQEKERLDAEREAAEEKARQDAGQNATRARADYAAAVKSAISSGKWGALQERMGEWEAAAPGLATQSEDASMAKAWVKEWTEARKVAASLGERLAGVHKAIVELHGTAPILGPAPAAPAVDWPEVGADRADLYCAELAAMEKSFLDAVRNIADPQSEQAAVLGPQPLRTLEAVWGFAGLSEKERLVELAEDADRSRDLLLPIEQWMEARAGLPLGAAELRKAPVAGLVEAAERADRLWAELFQAVEHVAPQISDWRRFEDEQSEPLLTEIAGMHNDAVLARRGYGENLRAWRLSEDHYAMEDLVRHIAEAYPLLKARKDAASN